MHSKSAEEPFSIASNRQKANDIGDLLRWGTIAAGGGAALAGVKGLAGMVGRNAAPPPPPLTRGITLPLRVPMEDEEEPAAPLVGRKAAAEVKVPPASGMFDTAGRALVSGLGMAHPVSPKTPPGMLQDWLMPRNATGTQSPLYAAGLAAGLPLAGLGGYHLASKLVDGAEDGEDESELATSRTNYERAMLGQYGAGKRASVDPILALRKASSLYGVLGGAGLGVAGLSAYAGYREGRGGGSGKISPAALREALRLRREQMQQATPGGIEAVLEPVPAEPRG